MGFGTDTWNNPGFGGGSGGGFPGAGGGGDDFGQNDALNEAGKQAGFELRKKGLEQAIQNTEEQLAEARMKRLMTGAKALGDINT
jgi:hypothetical protein